MHYEIFYRYILLYLENYGCPDPEKKDEVPWKKMASLLIFGKVTLINWPIDVRMPFDPRNQKGTFSSLNDHEYSRLADALEKTPVALALRAKPWPTGAFTIHSSIGLKLKPSHRFEVSDID